MAEPLNATFYAFRRRERGGVLIGASIAFLLLGMVLVGAFLALFWSTLATFVTWYIQMIGAAVGNDTSALESMGFPAGIFALIPGVLIWMFFFYLLYAAYEAACLRWMVRGETAGFFGLALDADTWRVYVTYWIWFGLYLAASTAMSIAMIAVMSVMALSGAGVSADAGAMATSMIAGMALIYVVYYGALIYFAVRFAPAAATSIARRRFSFFQAWDVTKGRFWALFGSFLLLWLIYLVFCLVLAVVGFGAVLGAAAPQLGELFTADPQQAAASSVALLQAYLDAFMQPQMWAVLGVMQLIGWAGGLALYVAMFGINARAAAAALDEGRIKVADAPA